MRRLLLPALLWVLALVWTGCGLSGESPADTARSFWLAIESDNFAVARELSNAASEGALESLLAESEIQAIETGEALRNDDEALVQTTLFGVPPRGDLSFQTHLTRYEQGWRVNLPATARELQRAHLGRSLEETQAALMESGRVLGDALERGAQQAAEALREAIEEFTAELEEELRREREEEQTPRDEQTL